MKAYDTNVTRALLRERTDRASDFPKAKWIVFCETLISEGYALSLYEARQTYSKYITIKRNGKRFKVRFSNHKPIMARELQGDCDFFVGVTNLGVSNYQDALNAVKTYFS